MPNYNAGQNHTIPDSSFILNNLFLSPISSNEIIHTLHNLSSFNATGSDGLSPQLLQCNATCKLKKCLLLLLLLLLLFY